MRSWHKKRCCWNCWGNHNILQCTRTLLKEKEKGDAHVTFDDGSAFFPHTTSHNLSRFVSSLEDVFFRDDEFDVYIDTKDDASQHHVDFLSTMCDAHYDSVDQNNRDNCFLRIALFGPRDDTNVEYEIVDFSVMSNMHNNHIDTVGMDHHQ